MKKNKHKKPLHKNRRPSASETHHAAPLEEIHAGKLFVVRDKDWEKVWGAYLSLEDAHKLKEQTAGRGHSRSVRYEEMPTDPELLELCAAFAPAASGPATGVGTSPVKPRQAAPVAAPGGGAAEANRRHAEVQARQRKAAEAKAALDRANALAAEADAALADLGDGELEDEVEDPLADELEAAPVEDLVGADDEDEIISDDATVSPGSNTGWGVKLVDLMVDRKICASRGEARRWVAAGAVAVDGVLIVDVTATLEAIPQVLRVGKTDHQIAQVG